MRKSTHGTTRPCVARSAYSSPSKSGGTRQTEAIGLVSVIPQAWMIGTPKRSS